MLGLRFPVIILFSLFQATPSFAPENPLHAHGTDVCTGAMEAASSLTTLGVIPWVAAGGKIQLAPPADRESYLRDVEEALRRASFPALEGAPQEPRDSTLLFAALLSDDRRWRLSQEEVATIESRVSRQMTGSLSKLGVSRTERTRDKNRLLLLVHPSHEIQKQARQLFVDGTQFSHVPKWLVGGRISPLQEADLAGHLDGIELWESAGIHERSALRELFTQVLGENDPTITLYGGHLEGSLGNVMVAIGECFFGRNSTFEEATIEIPTNGVTSGGSIAVPIVERTASLNTLLRSIVTGINPTTSHRLRLIDSTAAPVPWSATSTIKSRDDGRSLHILFRP